MKNTTVFYKKNKKSTFDLKNCTFLIMRLFTMILVLTITISVYGQLGTVSTPSFNTFQKINASHSYSSAPTTNYTTPLNNNSVQMYNNQQNMSVEEKNRMVMKMMNPNAKPPPTQADIKADLERKRTAVQYYQSKQEQQKQMIYAIVNEDKKYPPAKTYSYNEHGKYQFTNPNSTTYQKHIDYYIKAYHELNKMLTGEKPLSVKDAIYHVENAYLAGGLSSKQYNDYVSHYKHCVQLVAKKYKLDLANNIALQFAIQKLYNDTIYDPETQKHIPPLTYDFEDIMGDKDYKQLFVSKLMATGKGQCHSMPLLHKLLSDEFGGEAYLAYAPAHSYIQFKDDKGRFVNFETTNGSLTTNSFVVGSGYIKSEAILNKIYTKEVNTKQLIAQLLVELANSFKHKLGYDNFMGICTTTALKYYPNCIAAYMETANLETAKLDKTLFDAGYPTYNELPKHPKVKEQLDFVTAMYNQIDKLGYSTMPKEAYDEWLKSLGEEKQKQENEKLRIQLNFNKFE